MSVHMEDINRWSVEISDLLEQRLKEKGISRTQEQEDALADDIWQVLERHFNYPDYATHN